MKLLHNLNPPQQEAVLHGEGPMLVLAGAGSGKTRVIVHRIAYLIHERGVPPWQILAVTFTNKAAGEMRERIKHMLGEGDAPLVSTFHSTCARILRSDIKSLGYDSNFAIYDDKDCERLLKDCAAELNLDEKRYPVKLLGSAIDEFKNQGMSPFDVPADSPYQATLARVYRCYQERLKRCNAADFGDLLLLTVQLFEEHPEVLDKYLQRWRWIMVDEYQDTNPVQYRLVQLLAGARQNLCVVGDDDQSIYGWRGADIRNILEFEKDFPGVKVVKLEQNYRSTKTILDGAWHVVQKNRGRKPKRLWTDNPEGERIVYRTLPNEWEEGRTVCREVERFLAEGGDLSEVAVFYRTNAQSRVIEEALVGAQIPHHMVGGVRFYARLEVKDILAYLKVLDNPSDDVAVKRIINTPPRGIGNTTVQKISDFANEKGLPFYDAMLEGAYGPLLPAAARGKVAAFVNELEGYKSLSEKLPLSELTAAVINDSGYYARLKTQRTDEAQERIDNLQELVTAMQTYESGPGEHGLADFLERVALVSDLEHEGEGKKSSATLMTLHSAKGLEFQLVFMIGMEEKLFPHVRALENPEQMEEERRLCYVGMTRAKKRLFLLNVRRRHIFGQEQMNAPARFIADIPRELLDSGDLWQRPEPSRDFSASSHNLAALFEDEIEPEFEDNEVRMVPDDEDDSIWVGMKVRHAQFGPGTIRKIEGEGDNQKVIVWFNSLGGPKKLLVRFAGLERA
ncbi:UvrD-helicase domain-containing protein [Geomonas sp. Red69]|uniref:ATP-dependent helicase n=1 Tax=Geomonas diazotrophica TaxID=2843197 RepID=UPI001C1016AE|nr:MULTISPECIES: UvrD-helicase domain-containing protein [Geomonas]MBU5635325.1 UvrD-helicase domain-containing protein [Geomonas diazotrophica]QXE86759.1 UvrD-helicase domain-containing protein [Geomonas nitrogeniifigens]